MGFINSATTSVPAMGSSTELGARGESHITPMGSRRNGFGGRRRAAFAPARPGKRALQRGQVPEPNATFLNALRGPWRERESTNHCFLLVFHCAHTWTTQDAKPLWQAGKVRTCAILSTLLRIAPAE